MIFMELMILVWFLGFSLLAVSLAVLWSAMICAVREG